MARIRSLKPECWMDEKVGALSRGARLLWIGLITQADDDGRLRAAPALLRAHLFPYDEDVTVGSVETWIGEVEGQGLARLYQVDGERFAVLSSWAKHQRINRPTPSVLPDPSDADQGALNEASVMCGGGNGTERNGTELVAPNGASSTEVDAVWSAYQERHPHSKATKTRRALIARRLKDGWTADQLVAAIEGCHRSPFHMGDNDQGRRYDSLELILRNAEKVEQFIALADQPIEQLARKRHATGNDFRAIARQMGEGVTRDSGAGDIAGSEAARLLPAG